MPSNQQTVSTQWGVYVAGLDVVLPALDRRHAFELAQKSNAAAVWSETHPIDGAGDIYRPIVWTQPVEYGPESPAGECPFLADMTAQAVENEWKEWLR